ncbi:MFS transporter [Aquamicrobium sp. LC103]|uniref:MFS transporter n=1 Tax=Aquamicrobium sp. LC103 TaxID=1120658 RepID=UPI00063EB247|nr:MFS transporter [Aquamicrobium sp. LC103]TKT69386.1 MFS transporter [Aquamicrobium sp. LC103]
MVTQNRWLVLAVVSSALLLIVIDMTVLYTALPTLTHDLAASASEKLWIMNAYALVVAGLLPGSGALGDRFGHKRMFVGGLVVFGAASLAAAFAPSSAFLIAARVLLAVGAAMMMPATLSIIRVTFTDERERAFAFGIWAAVASGGAALGPVVGGILLHFFWWGSVFLINVPIVAIALVLAIAMIPRDAGHAGRPWDLAGSVQIMVGLVGIAYAIKTLGMREPDLAAAAVGAVIGLAALVIFVRRQRRSPAPLIDFTLFRDPRISAGVTAALVASIALVGVELVYSQRLQLVLGLSPLEAALLILPIPLAAFIAGPLTGAFLPRLGARTLIWSTLFLSAAGLGTFVLLQGYSQIGQIAALAAFGFGVGATMTAASTAIMANAPVDRAGMAASVEEVSYELGGAIGIAILGSLCAAIYSATMTLPGGTEVPATVLDGIDNALLAAESLDEESAARLIELARGAFDRAFAIVLWIAAAILAISAFAIRIASTDRQGAIASSRH